MLDRLAPTERPVAVIFQFTPVNVARRFRHDRLDDAGLDRSILRVAHSRHKKVLIAPSRLHGCPFAVIEFSRINGIHGRPAKPASIVLGLVLDDVPENLIPRVTDVGIPDGIECLCDRPAAGRKDPSAFVFVSRNSYCGIGHECPPTLPKGVRKTQG